MLIKKIFILFLEKKRKYGNDDKIPLKYLVFLEEY
jgi:hypothetical protein